MESQKANVPNVCRSCCQYSKSCSLLTASEMLPVTDHGDHEDESSISEIRLSSRRIDIELKRRKLCGNCENCAPGVVSNIGCSSGRLKEFKSNQQSRAEVRIAALLSA